MAFRRNLAFSFSLSCLGALTLLFAVCVPRAQADFDSDFNKDITKGFFKSDFDFDLNKEIDKSDKPAASDSSSKAQTAARRTQPGWSARCAPSRRTFSFIYRCRK